MTNPAPGTLAWFEVATDDPDKATAFYTDLFGWTFTPFADPAEAGVDLDAPDSLVLACAPVEEMALMPTPRTAHAAWPTTAGTGRRPGPDGRVDRCLAPDRFHSEPDVSQAPTRAGSRTLSMFSSRRSQVFWTTSAASLSFSPCRRAIDHSNAT